jgi:hypothetical protein
VKSLWQNRIDIHRGLRAVGVAAVIGLVAAVVVAFSTPNGPILCPAIYSLSVCVGWIAFASEPKQRIISAIAGLVFASWVIVDAASVTRGGDLAYLILVAIATQIICTIGYTVVFATRL